jgi:hypothetical protein
MSFTSNARVAQATALNVSDGIFCVRTTLYTSAPELTSSRLSDYSFVKELVTSVCHTSAGDCSSHTSSNSPGLSRLGRRNHSVRRAAVNGLLRDFDQLSRRPRKETRSGCVSSLSVCQGCCVEQRAEDIFNCRGSSHRRPMPSERLV